MSNHPPKVVKTERGWEPAFWSEHHNDYFLEPDSVAKATREEAEAALKADLEYAADCDAQDRHFQAQLAYACGYYN